LAILTPGPSFSNTCTRILLKDLDKVDYIPDRCGPAWL
jgi:hypothetical protein